MSEKYIIPYRQVIGMCIISCKTMQQLRCCREMIEHFYTVFNDSTKTEELHKLTNELFDIYYQAETGLSVDG